ncbi:arginine--tRNA ligase, partial [Candidatus Saccharibacteria bacterium]
MEQLSADIVAVCKQLYGTDVSVDMTRPDEQFGDYATNVALQLAKPLAKPPREIATQIADQLQERGIDASVAGPGFINVRLGDAVLVDEASSATRKPQLYGGKTVVAEYSDLNAFKQAHVGHLYTTIVGDVLSRLYEAAGAQVHRVNFGGDVGLHVAKNMWAILRFLGGENPEGLEQVSGDLRQRMAWLSARYVEGSQAYDSDEAAKAEIISTNRRVYDLHDQDDHSSAFAHIYWTCREWSYEYFKLFYDDLQVSQFERYYPESVTAPEGLRVVLEQLQKGVYSRSDGAVVFDGEQYGLHTRVFINSQGLPTYETKDVGLSIQKWRDYQFDESLIITGSDIVEYMKVVLKSIEQFEPQLAERTKHLTHGNVKLAGGVKMSSRLGNGLIPEDVLTAARAANRAATGKDDESAVLAAVKYAF